MVTKGFTQQTMPIARSQFEGAWFGLAIAESMLPVLQARFNADPAWQGGNPTLAVTASPILSATDGSSELPKTAQAVQLARHLIEGLHPDQPGLSWLEIQDRYFKPFKAANAEFPDPGAADPVTANPGVAESEIAEFVDQAVTLLPLWLLISDRPDAIAYLAQQFHAIAPTPAAAVSLTLTALTLRYLLAQPSPLNRNGCLTSPAQHPLFNQLRADLEAQDMASLSLFYMAYYEPLYAAVTQAPTLLLTRYLIQSLPSELGAIATALYTLTHLPHDFTQAIRCAAWMQSGTGSETGCVGSGTAIALSGMMWGSASSLGLPTDWRTAVQSLTFSPKSESLTAISRTLWQAWAGVYVPVSAPSP